MTALVKSIGRSISNHSPEILTGLGIAGMITTTVMAVKATPKALSLIEHKKEELELTESEMKAIDAININSRLRYDPDNCDFSIL